MKRMIALALVSLLPVCVVQGAEDAEVQLPIVNLGQPDTQGGKPLYQALKERKSDREYSSKPLPLALISQMLWSAAGINRPNSGKLTAPTAGNRQEISVYIATRDGLYLYDAKLHVMKMVKGEDIRAQTGLQDFVKDAPVNLIFVADMEKLAGKSMEDKLLYPAMDTGYISQNVYLFCASEGLATVARANIDKTALAAVMKLGPNQRVMLAQSVGYPRESDDSPKK